MSMACGSCHGRHETFREVRACSLGDGEGQPQSADSLQFSADELLPGAYELDGVKYQVIHSQKSGHNYAKRFVEESRRFEYAPGEIARLRPEHFQGSAKEIPEPEDGMYWDPDTGVIMKVQRAIHGSGRMVAKLLVIDGPGQGHFEYQGLAVNYLTGFEKMPLDRAMEYGKLYGFCVRCGITLTLEESIERGMGLTCASKGWA
jgi:hypothetical protein